MDPALNRIHRCVAIMTNLSSRPETNRTRCIYKMCQEAMVHTVTTLTQCRDVVKAYLVARTPKQFALSEHAALRNNKYTPAFLKRINDDIVMALLSHDTVSAETSLEQLFANLVIMEEPEDGLE